MAVLQVQTADPAFEACLCCVLSIYIRDVWYALRVMPTMTGSCTRCYDRVVSGIWESWFIAT